MRIVHAADFHLDSPFDGLDPRQAAQRRAEQRQLLERLADLCADRRAEAVFLAGDLLDGDAPYQETVQALSRALGRIGAPVFLAPGNHDCYAPRSPYAAKLWPENVHIFRSGQIEAVELPEQNAVVYGAAFTAAGRETGPLDGFAAPEDGRLKLMVLHGDVDGRAGSKYGAIPSAAIAASGLDYLALGHVHTCSGVRYAGAVPWAYPGCPEGRGFDETGDKGVLCGEILPGGRAQLEFVPLCARRYQIIELPVTAEDDEAAVARRAAAYAAPADCVRFVLTGESADAGLDLRALQAQCAPDFYSVSFRDRSAVRQNLWARAGEDTLTGLFLRTMENKLSGARSEEERVRLGLATRFGLAALENREDIMP